MLYPDILTYFNMLLNTDSLDGGDQVCSYPDILTYFSMPLNPDPVDGGDQVCSIRIF